MLKQKNLLCAISECSKISKDVYIVTLDAPDGISFNYHSGQYLFINMNKDDARPYSIATAMGDGKQLQMHIKDIPGNDFTGQVLQKLKTDTHINISLAAGSCTIERSSGTKPLLFITGGTGFSHSHALIETLFDGNDNRSISLYWGANTNDEIYHNKKVEYWAEQHQKFDFVPVINSDSESWSGEKGFVHESVFRNINNLQDYDIYLSGSSAMVFNIYRQLRTKDVPPTQIFSDMLDILREKEDLD